jgi:hypothetical protein
LSTIEGAQQNSKKKIICLVLGDAIKTFFVHFIPRKTILILVPFEVFIVLLSKRLLRSTNV